MVLFNYSTKELTAKVVYYGPGLCGKTTNLQWIHEKLPIKNKGKMLSLATETDRTLFFDFLPIELGSIRGMRTRIQLYTVPGQVFYNATRRMVLKGADCVVFVCDSQEPVLEANVESLENMRQNLEANEIDPDEIPLAYQYNKRDLPNALPIEILNEKLNPRSLPFFEAVAIKGVGVEETLRGATALVFKTLANKYGGEKPAAAPPQPIEVSGSTSSAPPRAVPLAPAAAAPAGPSTRPPGATATIPPVSPAGGDEEDIFESLDLQPALEESPPRAARPPSPAKARQRDTLVSSPEEADEIRRHLAGPPPAPVPELTLDEIDDDEDEDIEEISLESGPLPPWSPEESLFVRGEDTDPAGPEHLRPTPPARDPRHTPPAPAGHATTLVPVSVDLSHASGPSEIAIPIDVVLDGGTAQVQINLRLTLNLKLQQ